eukprot:CAMPEP_0175096094 /NCGR_PEP_ID=MMETSP0086_2-20121207/4540_1 /TAXON_ID=136419 /ORGANISM="Unknown Unknown, Strain D1" /LENGTH=78 /DNA_ID=CAMNT_0016369455 /DNA_START=25 /DNA_END=261 /DNA_ORIENTATION=-
MPNYELTVGMTCGGCSGAVTRIVGKLDGIEIVDLNIEAKKVVISSEANEEDTQAVVMPALQKWANAANKSLEWVGPVA